MIVFQHEPPVYVAGRALIVVSRIELVKHAKDGALLFGADKRPVAIICRGEVGEEIFDANGRRIDAAGLEALSVDRTA